MSFELVGAAEAERLTEGLVKQFGEGSRAFFAGKVFLRRGNHAWLATQECLAFLSGAFNAQQPGLLALTDVKNVKPSRELESLLRHLQGEGLPPH